jgi:monofunctional glycosyltransferase
MVAGPVAGKGAPRRRLRCNVFADEGDFLGEFGVAYPYHKRYKFIPLSQISPDLQHSVIAAEDARFYQHHGFDWHAIQLAAEEDMEGGRTRGDSTLTQQLVKNLFFGTGRSFLRKGAEATLVPVAEFVLGKQRILEL